MVLHLWMGLPFSHMLLAANASAIAWLCALFSLLAFSPFAFCEWILRPDPISTAITDEHARNAAWWRLPAALPHLPSPQD